MRMPFSHITVVRVLTASLASRRVRDDGEECVCMLKEGVCV
jgi:hypothetical protein